MNATKMSQCKRIVAYVLQFGSITTLEAVRDLSEEHLDHLIALAQGLKKP